MAVWRRGRGGACPGAGPVLGRGLSRGGAAPMAPGAPRRTPGAPGAPRAPPVPPPRPGRKNRRRYRDSPCPGTLKCCHAGEGGCGCVPGVAGVGMSPGERRGFGGPDGFGAVLPWLTFGFQGFNVVFRLNADATAGNGTGALSRVSPGGLLERGALYSDPVFRSRVQIPDPSAFRWWGSSAQRIPGRRADRSLPLDFQGKRLGSL